MLQGSDFEEQGQHNSLLFDTDCEHPNRVESAIQYQYQTVEGGPHRQLPACCGYRQLCACHLFLGEVGRELLATAKMKRSGLPQPTLFQPRFCELLRPDHQAVQYSKMHFPPPDENGGPQPLLQCRVHDAEIKRTRGASPTHEPGA